MASRRRIMFLVRSFAHAAQSRHSLHHGSPRLQKLGVNFKSGWNHEEFRFRSNTEKKLSEQDLKLVALEGEVNVLDGKIAEQVELHKKKEVKDAESLRCAIDDTKFSVIKGAAAYIGLTAAVASIVANIPRITAFFQKNGSGEESA